MKSTVGAFRCPCGYYRMLPKFSFSPLSASSPPEMKQTQKIKTPIPRGSHVDCSASLTKLTALQAPIAILSVCVYGRPGFYWWEKRYRCRHRHRFYRCVYARPNISWLLPLSSPLVISSIWGIVNVKWFPLPTVAYVLILGISKTTVIAWRAQRNPDNAILKSCNQYVYWMLTSMELLVLGVFSSSAQVSWFLEYQ